uniref:Uncharacterized protein n=1 Tax=Utricularia reniformis TaxID=192314 RepID=A0A1Y0AZG1_9LAMI|nr:hypothetical protein AEK19_MT0241 [Utricularia reniformis]ART30519.1 hypothetical protein AEK19_MT0241 [Utricularia reniformis]
MLSLQPVIISGWRVLFHQVTPSAVLRRIPEVVLLKCGTVILMLTCSPLR